MQMYTSMRGLEKWTCEVYCHNPDDTLTARNNAKSYGTYFLRAIVGYKKRLYVCRQWAKHTSIVLFSLCRVRSWPHDRERKKLENAACVLQSEAWKHSGILAPSVQIETHESFLRHALTGYKLGGKATNREAVGSADWCLKLIISLWIGCHALISQWASLWRLM
jgi:hypothetical protein